jgi:hypothetical protein
MNRHMKFSALLAGATGILTAAEPGLQKGGEMKTPVRLASLIGNVAIMLTIVGVGQRSAGGTAMAVARSTLADGLIGSTIGTGLTPTALTRVSASGRGVWSKAEEVPGTTSSPWPRDSNTRRLHALR